MTLCGVGRTHRINQTCNFLSKKNAKALSVGSCVYLLLLCDKLPWTWWWFLMASSYPSSPSMCDPFQVANKSCICIEHVETFS